MSMSDDTPRFTEKDLRAAHKAGYKKRAAQSPNYRGGYHPSFWDHEPLRKELGLGPKPKAKPKAPTTGDAAAIEAAENSHNAYSFPNYGEDEWLKCAQLLVARGCNAAETEAFLRSKHMRWCYDSAEDPCAATADDFESYLDRGRNFNPGNDVVLEARSMM